MSWSFRLAPLILLSACGGTVTDEHSGNGGADVGGSGRSGATGGEENGGSSSGGSTHATGGVGSGGKGSGGKGGTVGTGGKGGTSTREPANHRPTEVSCLIPIPAPLPNTGGTSSGVPQPTGGAPNKTLPQPSTGGVQSLLPPNTGGVPGGPQPLCVVDADCRAGANGRCIAGRAGAYCTYDACFKDGDCGPGVVCMCGTPGGTGNHCSQQGCRIDADCPGSWCSPTFSTCGSYSGVVGYACHTTTDECVDDTDCSRLAAGAYCMYSPMVAHWVCSSSQCAG